MGDVEVDADQLTPQERYDQLQLALAHEWQDDDLYAQASAITSLSNAWPLISDPAKNTALAQLAPRIPRCREAAVPTQLLVQILRLPTEQDMLRALLTKPKAVNGSDYLWTKPELIYQDLTGWLAKYLDYAKWNYVPLGFHFWTSICLLGAVCKNTIYFDSGQFCIYPNWYAFLVGDSATGKSAAASLGVDLIERLNRNICPSSDEVARLPFGRQFVNCLPNDINKQAIIKKLSELRYNPKPVPSKKSDGTAVSPGLDQPVDATCLIYIDELANLLGKQAYKPTELVSFLTQAKESRKYDKALASDSTEKNLKELAISLVACCAPSWLRDNIDPTTLGGGFADRTTYVYREPVWERKILYSPFQLQDCPRDPILAEQLALDLKQITDIEHKVVPVVTRDARLLGDKIYIQLVEEEELRFKSIGSTDDITSSGRAFNDVLRMTLMLSVSDALGHYDFPRIEITDHHIDLAFRLVSKEEKSMRNFIARSQERSAEPIELRIQDQIAKLGDTCIKRSLFVKDKMRGYRVSMIIPGAKQLMEEEKLVVRRLGTAELWATFGHECAACRKGTYVEASKLTY